MNHLPAMRTTDVQDEQLSALGPTTHTHSPPMCIVYKLETFFWSYNNGVVVNAQARRKREVQTRQIRNSRATENVYFTEKVFCSMANDTACDGHIYLYMVIWEVNGSFKETAGKTPKRGFLVRPTEASTQR